MHKAVEFYPFSLAAARSSPAVGIPPGSNLHQDRIHPVIESSTPRRQQRQGAAADQSSQGTRKSRIPEHLRSGSRRQHEAQRQAEDHCGRERYAGARDADQHAVAARGTRRAQFDLARKSKSNTAAPLFVSTAVSAVSALGSRANGAIVAPQRDPTRPLFRRNHRSAT